MTAILSLFRASSCKIRTAAGFTFEKNAFDQRPGFFDFAHRYLYRFLVRVGRNITLYSVIDNDILQRLRIH